MYYANYCLVIDFIVIEASLVRNCFSYKQRTFATSRNSRSNSSVVLVAVLQLIYSNRTRNVWHRCNSPPSPIDSTLLNRPQSICTHTSAANAAVVVLLVLVAACFFDQSLAS